MNEPSPGVLHAEHVLLGAEFVPSPCTGAPCVSAYARETAEPVGAVLADLTGATYLLASGSDADAFIAASLAGRRLAVGEVAFEATLTGTGALVSVPLLARTGDHEFVVVDAGPRGGSLSAWLEFLAHASSEEAPAFPDLGLEDASDMLVPLLLAGPAAGRVLSDYVHGDERLPEQGTVLQLHLDAITVIVARPAASFLPPAYLVLVPVGAARVLWRSLLSFTEVEPIGHVRLRSLLSRQLPWAEEIEGDPRQPARADLESWGVVRPSSDFVGARALG